MLLSRALTTLLISATLSAGAWASEGPARPPIMVKVGDAAANGMSLRPYDNVWRLTVESVAGKTTGFRCIWTDHLEAVKKEGRDLLQRTQSCGYTNGTMNLVINVFDPRTMAPVSSLALLPDGTSLSREFRAGRLSSRRKAHLGAKEESDEVDLGAPVFDFMGGMYGLLLSTFPLREGYSATFSTASEVESTAEPVTFRVVRKEQTTAGSRGAREAWVLQVDDMTFWVSKEPPYVLRLVIERQGNIIRWEML
jgi:hypothetical protein